LPPNEDEGGKFPSQLRAYQAGGAHKGLLNGLTCNRAASRTPITGGYEPKGLGELAHRLSLLSISPLSPPPFSFKE